MLLSSKVHGKPYSAEQLLDDEDPSSIEANPELNPVVKAASIFRSKRNPSNHSKFLKDYCSRPMLLTQQQLGSRHSCEAGSYMCLGYTERVCKEYSFACLQSILTVNASKCSPHYEWVTIDLGAGGRRKVRRTKACNCA